MDEVVYQFVRNDGILPLLTLYYLKKQAKSSLLFVPELEIRKDRNQTKPSKEIDICCILDGRIILGESRTTRIDKKLLDTTNEFATKFLRPPDQLVFSTFAESISDEIRNYADSTIRFPFILLKISDLLVE